MAATHPLSTDERQRPYESEPLRRGCFIATVITSLNYRLRLGCLATAFGSKIVDLAVNCKTATNTLAPRHKPVAQAQPVKETK